MGRADEVVNHLDFPINPEQFQRVAFEAVRYSRHRIGFVDGVGNDRFECGVFPKQSDVRSMQRRDNGQVDAFLSEDITRGNRGTRVGNGVVHMEQIEVMGFGHFDHLRGQDQFIRLVIEKRIVADTYLVVVEVFFQTPHARGSAVRNEMEFVPLVREGLAQFSGDHTGPPERGVTHKANAQVLHSNSLLKRDGIPYALYTWCCTLVRTSQSMSFRFSAEGKVRLLKNTKTMSWSGSAHARVPVNPE